MEWQCYFVGIFIVIAGVVLLLCPWEEKCPNCGKRGGIHNDYEDRYEKEGGRGEAYYVKNCHKCGHVISEVFHGETRDCGNR